MNDSGSETESEDEGLLTASRQSTIPADAGSPHIGVAQRSISPPSLKRKLDDVSVDPERATRKKAKNVYVPSTIRLTRIKKSPDQYNVDCITLHDLIGDPDIIECWQFNFLFDVDFLMSAFHKDVRNKIKVKVVHGSWKKEDSNRQGIEEAIGRWPNVQHVAAYMPMPFGTHHTKMMVVFRNDSTAQIAITTANMISVDWANMTQAMWRSPVLPRTSSTAPPSETLSEAPMGSGLRFKQDFLDYLKAYGASKTGQLVEALADFDFSSIKAALIGSTPSTQQSPAHRKAGTTLWGWQGLREIMRSVPTKSATEQSSRPTIVSQVSSIASLGITSTWLDNLLQSLSGSQTLATPPRHRIMFPSPDEIRRSIGGYRSGASIHSPDNTTLNMQRQLSYLKPKMVYWAGDGVTPAATSGTPVIVKEAGRRRAAPHIKTYVRFTDDDMQTIDWAMMTSANISKQAWGELPNKKGEVRIASWELGVVVWPELFQGAGHERTTMVPTFKMDTPLEAQDKEGETFVGFRMPYDLPLVQYEEGETLWCNKIAHTELDWMGKAWPQ